MRTSSALLFLSTFVVLSLVPLRSCAQTDVAISVYGALNPTSQSSYIRQSPANQAGVLFEARHIWNPLIGFEGAYAYNRANQTYSPLQSSACSTGSTGCLQVVSASVPANAHEATGDWLVSAKVMNLKLFGLAGGGLLFDVPAARASFAFRCTPTGASCLPGDIDPYTKSQTKGVFVYGAGLDWTILPHLGLRFQYRGNVYKAPALIDAFSSSGKFTETAEPVLGAFFRF